MITNLLINLLDYKEWKFKMSKLPLLTAKELSKILLNLGFENKRQKGSHIFFEQMMEEQQ